MALDSTALITVAELKLYIWGSAAAAPATYDDLLEDIVNGVSLGIARWLENALIIQTFTEDYSGGVKPWIRGGQKRMKLLHYPIQGVTSITDDDSNTVPAADYTIVAELGWLEHDATFPVPAGRWTVVYSAGLYADESAVPADVKLAACRVAIGVFKQREPGVKSKKIDSIAVTYDLSEVSAGLIPPEVESLLPGRAQWV